jgi:transposase
VVAIVDAQGKKVFGRRLLNDLARIEQCFFAVYRERLCGVVIESTFNWYWLVDGLMDRGYQLHLANTTSKASKRLPGRASTRLEDEHGRKISPQWQ